jgi:hypothetical protein
MRAPYSLPKRDKAGFLAGIYRVLKRGGLRDRGSFSHSNLLFGQG